MARTKIETEKVDKSENKEEFTEEMNKEAEKESIDSTIVDKKKKLLER